MVSQAVVVFISSKIGERADHWGRRPILPLGWIANAADNTVAFLALAAVGLAGTLVLSVAMPETKKAVLAP